jgi:two-component system response regulator FixJ
MMSRDKPAVEDGVVHVVDDDDAVRRSMAFLLATDGLSVRLYGSALGFLDGIDRAAPGCVVTDVRMPGVDGLELLRRVRASRVQIPVIVMTGHADIAMAVQSIKEGAVDFIEKPFDDARFLRVVRAALSRAQADERPDPEMVTRLASLSERERQVLDGVLGGKANKVIAFDLGLSARTIEVYRANLMVKMGADNVADLVRKAIQVA